MVIEIYVDIIRVSHGFDGCQMLRFIADIGNSALGAGIDDITSFFRYSFLPIRWSNNNPIRVSV
jgi:hypothetical protein